MKNRILTVSLRQKAVFIPQAAVGVLKENLSQTTGMLAANLARLGFGLSEPLLHALNHTNPAFQYSVLAEVQTVMGVDKNWTPLVKGWDKPTGESIVDHIVTLFANIFQTGGTRLPCGHIIPPDTFPLERYNGCPFCGTPFVFGKIEKYGQGSKLKVLDLWTEADAQAFLADLLTSKTALDATQMDSLKVLLAEFPLPSVTISMKETLIAVIDILVEQGQPEKAQVLFTSPTDVMRYLWYKHTGFLQILEPKTIVRRLSKNNAHVWPQLDTSAKTKLTTKARMKLKYNRKTCAMVASWMNGLDGDVEKLCEMMHPKREMWVRFIRALRLAEYSHRPGHEKLKVLLDVFYNKLYNVWQGSVSYYRLRADADKTFGLLKHRPGLFARSLFSNMLWFGADETIGAFSEVIDKVPARLVFTLNMYAENYFDKGHYRTVKPLGGISKTVPPHKLLSMYDDAQLEAMKDAVESLSILAMQKRFAAAGTTAKTMYIDPALFRIPVSIGDRSENVQDIPSALMGTRFEVEGDTVRLFMQWGTGLRAQHMDMDLSCQIAYEGKTDLCSFSQLTTTGCKHSGDIRSIPDKVGTAEYIEIYIPDLQKAKAKYVSFTCNAYSNGSITPNLVVGWMNSRYPMRISESTGVAYDPSTVQHQVRITHSLTKGMVFGVLDVSAREIIWLEMPFGGQVVQGLDTNGVASLIKKLDSKLSIGRLLQVKAEAQGMQLAESQNADEVYTQQWAQNTAAVTKLLVD